MSKIIVHLFHPHSCSGHKPGHFTPKPLSYDEDEADRRTASFYEKSPEVDPGKKHSFPPTATMISFTRLVLIIASF
jgi:hypothetical protein